MADFCFLHVNKGNLEDHLIRAGEKTWIRIKECSKKWISTENFERTIAEKVNILAADTNVVPVISYHRQCYQHYTNKIRILQAERKKERGK